MRPSIPRPRKIVRPPKSVWQQVLFAIFHLLSFVLGSSGAGVSKAPRLIRPLLNVMRIAETRAAEEGETATPFSAPPAPASFIHEVVAGETLWSIADQEYGEGQRWIDIWHANRASIQSANLIQVGQRLIIPDVQFVASALAVETSVGVTALATEADLSLSPALRLRVVREMRTLADSLQSLVSSFSLQGDIKFGIERAVLTIDRSANQLSVSQAVTSAVDVAVSGLIVARESTSAVASTIAGESQLGQSSAAASSPEAATALPAASQSDITTTQLHVHQATVSREIGSAITSEGFIPQSVATSVESSIQSAAEAAGKVISVSNIDLDQAIANANAAISAAEAALDAHNLNAARGFAAVAVVSAVLAEAAAGESIPAQNTTVAVSNLVASVEEAAVPFSSGTATRVAGGITSENLLEASHPVAEAIINAAATGAVEASSTLSTTLLSQETLPTAVAVAAESARSLVKTNQAAAAAAATTAVALAIQGASENPGTVESVLAVALAAQVIDQVAPALRENESLFSNAAISGPIANASSQTVSMAAQIVQNAVENAATAKESEGTPVASIIVSSTASGESVVGVSGQAVGIVSQVTPLLTGVLAPAASDTAAIAAQDTHVSTSASQVAKVLAETVSIISISDQAAVSPLKAEMVKAISKTNETLAELQTAGEALEKVAGGASRAEVVSAVETVLQTSESLASASQGLSVVIASIAAEAPSSKTIAAVRTEAVESALADAGLSVTANASGTLLTSITANSETAVATAQNAGIALLGVDVFNLVDEARSSVQFTQQVSQDARRFGEADLVKLSELEAGKAMQSFLRANSSAYDAEGARARGDQGATSEHAALVSKAVEEAKSAQQAAKGIRATIASRKAPPVKLPVDKLVGGAQMSGGEISAALRSGGVPSLVSAGVAGTLAEGAASQVSGVKDLSVDLNVPSITTTPKETATAIQLAKEAPLSESVSGMQSFNAGTSDIASLSGPVAHEAAAQVSTIATEGMNTAASSATSIAVSESGQAISDATALAAASPATETSQTATTNFGSQSARISDAAEGGSASLRPGMSLAETNAKVLAPAINFLNTPVVRQLTIGDILAAVLPPGLGVAVKGLQVSGTEALENAANAAVRENVANFDMGRALDALNQNLVSDTAVASPHEDTNTSVALAGASSVTADTVDVESAALGLAHTAGVTTDTTVNTSAGGAPSVDASTAMDAAPTSEDVVTTVAPVAPAEAQAVAVASSLVTGVRENAPVAPPTGVAGAFNNIVTGIANALGFGQDQSVNQGIETGKEAQANEAVHTNIAAHDTAMAEAAATLTPTREGPSGTSLPGLTPSDFSSTPTAPSGTGAPSTTGGVTSDAPSGTLSSDGIGLQAGIGGQRSGPDSSVATPEGMTTAAIKEATIQVQQTIDSMQAFITAQAEKGLNVENAQLHLDRIQSVLPEVVAQAFLNDDLQSVLDEIGRIAPDLENANPPPAPQEDVMIGPVSLDQTVSPATAAPTVESAVEESALGLAGTNTPAQQTSQAESALGPITAAFGTTSRAPSGTGAPSSSDGVITDASQGTGPVTITTAEDTTTATNVVSPETAEGAKDLSVDPSISPVTNAEGAAAIVENVATARDAAAQTTAIAAQARSIADAMSQDQSVPSDTQQHAENMAQAAENIAALTATTVGVAEAAAEAGNQVGTAVAASNALRGLSEAENALGSLWAAGALSALGEQNPAPPSMEVGLSQGASSKGADATESVTTEASAAAHDMAAHEAGRTTAISAAAEGAATLTPTREGPSGTSLPGLTPSDFSSTPTAPSGTGSPSSIDGVISDAPQGTGVGQQAAGPTTGQAAGGFASPSESATISGVVTALGEATNAVNAAIAAGAPNTENSILGGARVNLDNAAANLTAATRSDNPEGFSIHAAQALSDANLALSQANQALAIATESGLSPIAAESTGATAPEAPTESTPAVPGNQTSSVPNAAELTSAATLGPISEAFSEPASQTSLASMVAGPATSSTSESPALSTAADLATGRAAATQAQIAQQVQTEQAAEQTAAAQAQIAQQAQAERASLATPNLHPALEALVISTNSDMSVPSNQVSVETAVQAQGIADGLTAMGFPSEQAQEAANQAAVSHSIQSGINQNDAIGKMTPLGFFALFNNNPKLGPIGLVPLTGLSAAVNPNITNFGNSPNNNTAGPVAALTDEVAIAQAAIAAAQAAAGVNVTLGSQEAGITINTTTGAITNAIGQQIGTSAVGPAASAAAAAAAAAAVAAVNAVAVDVEAGLTGPTDAGPAPAADPGIGPDVDVDGAGVTSGAAASAAAAAAGVGAEGNAGPDGPGGSGGGGGGQGEK